MIIIDLTPNYSVVWVNPRGGINQGIFSIYMKDKSNGKFWEVCGDKLIEGEISELCSIGEKEISFLKNITDLNLKS